MRLSFYKNLLILISIFNCFGNIALPYINRLILHKGSDPSDVKLPFKYRGLSDEEKKRTTYLPECFYAVIDPTVNPNDFILVGPLRPCILVAVKNIQNGRAVVFHKHYSNSIAKMIQTIKKELLIDEKTDAKALVGKVFSVKFPLYEQETETVLGRISFKQQHQNKSQKEELSFIKNALLEGLNISDRSQIDANIFNKTYKGTELGEYHAASTYVLVDNDLTFYSISAMHEHVFPLQKETSTVEEKIDATEKLIDKVVSQLILEHFLGKVSFKQLHTYDTVHFEKIEEKLA